MSSNVRVRWALLTAEKTLVNYWSKKKMLFELALWWGKQLFVNSTEIIKFKATDSKIATPLCLGNISNGQ